jgi:hypothetical protein
LLLSLSACIKTVCFTVVNQFYEAEILTEYVIRGNTAVLKCSIPSFVADFVQVEAWIAEDGEMHVPSSQNYGTLKYDYRYSRLMFFPLSFLTLCFQW